MSTPHAIQTIFEILIVVAVIIALLYEPALVKWEQKQKQKILQAFNKRKEYRN